MAKARAVGADITVLTCAEATYGTAPDGSATGVYTRPFLKSTGLGGSQPLEADDLINTGGPDDRDASLGAFDASGDLVAPLDVRSAGFWMTMALGAEATPTDHMDGTFTHAWSSGADLKSFTVQTAHTKLTTPKFRSVLGAKANGFSFPMARNGRALVTLPMIGQSEVKDTVIKDTAPKTFVYKPFDNATGGIKIGGVALANVVSAQINFSNGLEAAEAIRSDTFIDGVDETIRTCSGTVTLRLGTDHTIDDLIDANGSAALDISFALKATPTWKLNFNLPRVFFELTKKAVTGPGGVQVSTTFRAAHDDSAGWLLKATLLNDVAAY